MLGYAGNVSETGLFLECPLPPPAGTRLTLELKLPGDRNVVARGARVVWIRNERRRPGMGIALAELDHSERWLRFCRDQRSPTV